LLKNFNSRAKFIFAFCYQGKNAETDLGKNFFLIYGVVFDTRFQRDFLLDLCLSSLMLNFIKKIFRKKKMAEVPAYPPKPSGYPAVTVDRMLQENQGMLNKIFSASRGSQETFNAMYMPVIRHMAAHVHLLPASADHHHRIMGGLFSHSLSTGFYCLRLCYDVLFALDEPPSVRRRVSPIWEYASFCSGMWHDAGKMVTDVRVFNGDLVWQPRKTTLLNWLRQNQLKEYFVAWDPGREHKKHEQASAYMINEICPPKQLEILYSHDPEIFNSLHQAILEPGNQDNVLAKILLQADRASVRDDLARMPVTPVRGEKDPALTVDYHVQAAITGLLKSGKWTVNQKGSRVWMIDEKLFVVWPQGIKEAISLAAEKKNTPASISHLSLVGLFADKKIIVLNDQGEAAWRIRPAILGKELSAVMFRDAASIINPVPSSTAGTILSNLTEKDEKDEEDKSHSQQNTQPPETEKEKQPEIKDPQKEEKLPEKHPESKAGNMDFQQEKTSEVRIKPGSKVLPLDENIEHDNILLQIAAKVSRGELKWDKDLMIHNSLLAIVFPGSFENLEKTPVQMITVFDHNGLLAKDVSSMNPKRLWTIRKINYVVIKKSYTQRFLLHVQECGQEDKTKKPVNHSEESPPEVKKDTPEVNKNTEAKTKGTATEQDAPKPALPVSSPPKNETPLYQKFDQALCQAVTDGRVPGKATEDGVLVKHDDALAYWREEFKRPPSQIKRYFHKLKHTRIEA
jgi:hypothetical protein